jgi:hypothetical protein
MFNAIKKADSSFSRSRTLALLFDAPFAVPTMVDCRTRNSIRHYRVLEVAVLSAALYRLRCLERFPGSIPLYFDKISLSVAPSPNILSIFLSFGDVTKGPTKDCSIALSSALRLLCHAGGVMFGIRSTFFEG